MGEFNSDDHIYFIVRAIYIAIYTHTHSLSLLTGGLASFQLGEQVGC